MNEKGLQSYCQECEACSVCLDTKTFKPESTKYQSNLFDIIVDEIVNSINPGLQNRNQASNSPEYPLIPLGISNRHIHLTESTLYKLFGTGTNLEIYRELYQTGEFASKQQVTIVGPKMRSMAGVRILGPLRKADQVEISLSDAIFLGVKAPVRNSGDLDDAAPITLIGPQGSVYLESAAIIASRHIHMSEEDAALYNVQDGDYCKVRIPGVKGTVFENVLIRVKDSFKLQMHLDTDDANAAYAQCNGQVEFLEKM